MFAMAFFCRKRKLKHVNNKIVWFGAYGNSNKGDDFIFWALKKFIPSKYTIFLSCRDSKFKDEYNVCTFQKGENSFSVLRNIKVMKKASVFIIGGGGLLESYDDSEDSRRLKMAYIAPFLLAKILGLRTLILGIGCNKVHSHNVLLERAIGFMYANSDVIVTRDKKSLQGFAECSNRINKNAIWTYDPVFTLPLRIMSKKKTICFLLWPFFLWPEFYSNNVLNQINETKKKKHMLFLEEIKSCILEVKQKGYTPIFPVFHFSDRLLLKELGVECYECNKEEYMRIIGNSTLVVTMRYHGQITSLLNHTPIISLVVQEKMGELVKNMAIEEFSFSNLECFNREKFLAMFDKAIKHNWTGTYKSFDKKRSEANEIYNKNVYEYLNSF